MPKFKNIGHQIIETNSQNGSFDNHSVDTIVGAVSPMTGLSTPTNKLAPSIIKPMVPVAMQRLKPSNCQRRLLVRRLLPLDCQPKSRFSENRPPNLQHWSQIEVFGHRTTGISRRRSSVSSYQIGDLATKWGRGKLLYF